MQKKSVIAGIIVIALLIAGAIWSRERTESEHIRLGVILPLTGDAASYGEHARNAVELAQEKAKKDFGIVFDLRYEDSQIKPALAASAAQKLISVDDVQYLIGFSSGETLAICPITEAGKRILLSSGSSSAVSDCGEYTFRNYPSDIFQGKALAKKLTERGVSSVALLYITNDYGTGLRKEFARNFKGEPVLEEGHAAETRDFRTTLAKLKAAKSDAVVLISQIAEASTLLKQMHEQNISIPVFGSEALKDDALIENTPAEALQQASVLFTASYGGPEASSFKDAYTKRFGKEPGAFADYVYDNVMLLGKALQLCKKPEVECVRQKLDRIIFTGATGAILFDKNGDVQNKPYELYRVENGKFILAR